MVVSLHKIFVFVAVREAGLMFAIFGYNTCWVSLQWYNIFIPQDWVTFVMLMIQFRLWFILFLHRTVDVWHNSEEFLSWVWISCLNQAWNICHLTNVRLFEHLLVHLSVLWKAWSYISATALIFFVSVASARLSINGWLLSDEPKCSPIGLRRDTLLLFCLFLGPSLCSFNF